MGHFLGKNSEKKSKVHVFCATLYIQFFQILVLRAFSVRFTFLDSCFRTCQIFPQPEDTRYVLHYGQYLDNARIEDFFSDDKDPAESAR